MSKCAQAAGGCGKVMVQSHNVLCSQIYIGWRIHGCGNYSSEIFLSVICQIASDK